MVPSRRFIIMFLLLAGLFVVGAIVPPFTVFGVMYLLLLLLVAAIDMARIPRARSIVIKRLFPERISLGVPSEVALEIENLSRTDLYVRVAELLPENIECVEFPETVIVRGRRRETVKYRLLASKRGHYSLSRMDVRIWPAMGLFIKQFKADVPGEVQVFPNLVNVRKYELQLRKGMSAEEGLARLRMLGQGSDFESLRVYSPGDDTARLDWKATAKRGEPILRNYQPERQQSILVALDVGRATAGEFKGMSRLDYYINSILMFAYVALRQGDWFSVVAFSDRIESYLPPVRNVKNVDSVARALYRLEQRLVESDYSTACGFLDLKSRRRSLICLMTDVIDKQASDVIISYMAHFARRHLPLAVTLTDTDIKEIVEQPLSETSRLYRKAVAIDFATAREEALAMMRRYGVDVLDVSPEALTPELINRYLLIKSTRRL